MKNCSVKIVSGTDKSKFENEINSFIHSVDLVDIKFTTTDHPRYSALIIYNK